VLARNKAAGQSETVSYTVSGWHDGHGEPWSVGYLVDVDDERLRVRGKMVVVSATFRFGPREPWNTSLELAWPEAFDEVDYPTRGRGAVWS
jgi:prophage tail gpP-like protein